MPPLNEEDCLSRQKRPLSGDFDRFLKSWSVSILTHHLSTLLALVLAIYLVQIPKAYSADDMEEILSLFDRYYEELDPADPKNRSSKSSGAGAEREIDQLFERKAAAHDKQKEEFWNELARMEFSPLGEVTLRDPSAPIPQDDNEPDPELDAFLAELDAPDSPATETSGPYQGPYRAGFEPEPTRPQEETIIQGSGAPRLIEFKGKPKSKTPPKSK